MPVYDFKCKETSEHTTRFCDIDERKDQRCNCGEALEQMISVPNVIGANSGGRNDRED